MTQTECGILNQISNALAGQTAPEIQPLPVGEIGFTGATAINDSAIFDFDPTQDVLLFDGEPVNENGLPQDVQAFKNTDGDTVVQFKNGETQTLHGASYDDFLDFIDTISINAAADTMIAPPMVPEEIEPDFDTDDFIDDGDSKTLPVFQFNPDAQVDAFDDSDDADDVDNIFVF